MIFTRFQSVSYSFPAEQTPAQDPAHLLPLAKQVFNEFPIQKRTEKRMMR
jgi:hypothetical protein